MYEATTRYDMGAKGFYAVVINGIKWDENGSYGLLVQTVLKIVSKIQGKH